MIREIDTDVETESEDWSCYRLNLTNDVVIDIPREMSDLKNYSASLGHKVQSKNLTIWEDDYSFKNYQKLFR